MQEIAPHIFIETGFPGVTLGAVDWPRGLILIDSPFRPDDFRIWRQNLQASKLGVEKLLINLDEHPDRTLGSRQIECMLIAHEKINQLVKDRPNVGKPLTIETGADWELFSPPANIRWSPPEITFSEQLEIHADDHTLLLEAHPGPSSCAIWAHFPEEKVFFVGDAVMQNIPPFLANADITAWKDTLEKLQSPAFRNHVIVSGRSGIVSQHDVKTEHKLLEKIEKQMEKLSAKPLRVEDIHKSAQSLLKLFDVPRSKEVQYLQRLVWGLTQYLRRQYGTSIDLNE